MARSRGFASSHDDSIHGNRPWVYCMIDAFFLITMFFVMTFHVKNEEKVLPQALSTHGGCKPGNVIYRGVFTLPVHIAHNGATIKYVINAQELTLPQLESALQENGASSRKYVVRVSYDAHVPFGDVMSVFNACKKAGIDECGMVPLRNSESL